MAETFLKIVIQTAREPSIHERKDIEHEVAQALKAIEYTGEPRENQITGAFVMQEVN